MTQVVAPVKEHVFKAMQNVDINALKSCSDADLRPVLPGLVRMALCAPLDTSDKGKKIQKNVLGILSRLDVVNSIVDMLSIDFHALEQDVKKEQQLRAKLGGNMTESVLVSNLQRGIALEFERSESDPAHRIRLLLSELLFILSEIKDQKAGNYQKQSDLFECPVYINDILDALCIAMAELPELLSLLDMSEALLCLEMGPRLVCCLVANKPESFLEVCNSLIARGEKQEEDSLGGRRRLNLLRMLCSMNPSAALSVRNLCIDHCTMPGFAVAVSIHMCQMSEASTSVEDPDQSDVVPFITSLLLGSDVWVRNWISSFVKAGQKRRPSESPCMLTLLREHLLKDLRRLTPQQGEMMKEEDTVKASALIRLYCALKGIATMKYSEEEIGCLLQLVISRPSQSRAGAHFISLGICTLMASPGLLRTEEEEEQVVSWLRWLMSSETHFDRYSDKTDSPGEMLFLLALNFHNNQMTAIHDLVCTTLGMKISVKTSALVKIRQIFTMKLFTEQVVAAHAVKIPVTSNLDARSVGYLPVHTILQLLKSRVFSKHKVSVKEWVVRQINHSRFPLHPMMPQLIESYVNSVIPKTAKPEHTNEPISEEDIISLFETRESSPSPDGGDGPGSQERQLCPQLLILYYLLLYEDLYHTHKKMIDVTKLSLYNDRVMSQIPISYLVQEALKQQNNCQNLFPPMIRLLSIHLPHLCLVEDWLDSHVGLMSGDATAQSQVRRKRPKRANKHKFEGENVKQALSQADSHPSEAVSLMEDLHAHGSLEELSSCQEAIMSSIPSLLQSGIPRRLQDLVKKVWFRLHALTPRKLRLNTINALQPNSRSEPLTEQDLVVDPLVVLRCDDRIFRCPPMLEILLRILSAYMQACRVYLSSHIIDAVSTEKEKDRQELKTALLAAQDSAIVQILFEICLPLKKEREVSGELCDLREIRCLVFSYIHQLFIADPNLAKLVHFQGYPQELIPLVVAGVPSMHICLDFIPELLGQPQRNKQIFGVQLLSHLCCQYHLPKSMNIAKLGIDVMFTLLSVLEKHEWVSFFIQTVPSLVHICEAFPPLCDEATALLTQLGRVCYSHLTLEENASKTCFEKEKDKERSKVSGVTSSTGEVPGGAYESLHHIVQATFTQICERAVVTGKLY